ncbi:MAG TPA: hypothetical protein VKZ50_17335 [bacterium]|nr:hypothetical protein [bacterium]
MRRIAAVFTLGAVLALSPAATTAHAGTQIYPEPVPVPVQPVNLVPDDSNTAVASPEVGASATVDASVAAGSTSR